MKQSFGVDGFCGAKLKAWQFARRCFRKKRSIRGQFEKIYSFLAVLWLENIVTPNDEVYCEEKFHYLNQTFVMLATVARDKGNGVKVVLQKIRNLFSCFALKRFSTSDTMVLKQRLQFWPAGDSGPKSSSVSEPSSVVWSIPPMVSGFSTVKGKVTSRRDAPTYWVSNPQATTVQMRLRKHAITRKKRYARNVSAVFLLLHPDHQRSD